LDTGVEKVLLVSTDKAANPINLYGATKLCAEKLLVAANAYRRASQLPPCFSVVRYGNVMGSRGSIVETINEQKKSGEVTLTDAQMTRFWITLDKAIDLVLYALATMRGGEIFVPKLPAMKVVDLIKSLAPECRIKLIGIRPGEKIHEDLLTSDEARRTRDAGEYYIVEPSHEWWQGEHLKESPYLPPNFNYSSNEVRPLNQEDFLNFV